ncbi:hypothetical protein LTR56_024289 [Elasticomyces elasticus]|nr:hypothetical protein LTR56_024289 [Elasticomyces elasticus]KAK4905894.1 hypothetical protein LTR49_024864 [Elasticomyces elasticus]
MDTLLKSLQSERLIKIFVGPGTTMPYHVPQTILHTTSDYFTKALLHETSLGAAETGVLRFPEDDVDVWGILLYWMLIKELPETALGTRAMKDQELAEFELLLVRCWAVGERYQVPQFQDLVMLELLVFLYRGHSPLIGLVTLKEAFATTPPGRPMRKLVARNVAQQLRGQSLHHNDLDMFDGIAGCMAEIVKAVGELPSCMNGCVMPQQRDQKKVATSMAKRPWDGYMVAGGPEEHRVYASLTSVPACRDTLRAETLFALH